MHAQTPLSPPMQTTSLSLSLSYHPQIAAPSLLLLSPYSTAPHTFMEERVPPSLSPPQPPPIYTNHSQSSQLQLPNFSNGTYVVQVPRDQVYRIPPPENARIAEHHRNSTERVQKRKQCWTYVRIIAYIAIALFIGGLLGGFFLVLNSPKNPRFSIQHFHFHNATKPTYNIILHVYNPNSIAGIFYKEGDVSLLTRQREIASGAYPTLFQPRRSSTVVTLALKGLKGKLPKVVHESMTKDKKKVHVTFSLTMHVPARTKMGKLHGGTKKYDITCQGMVDTLAKATRVLSQDCQTKRH